MGRGFTSEALGEQIRSTSEYPEIAGKRVWIDAEDYSTLIARLRPEVDPPSLMISGFVDRQGAFSPAAWDYLPNATLSDDEVLPSGQHYAIKVLDRAGQVLSETTRPLPFTMFVEGLDLPVDTSLYPVAITVPFHADAHSVQVAVDGVPTFEQTISDKLLADAVRALPDEAFLWRATELRTALLNQILAYSFMIQRGGDVGAKQELSNAIRRNVTRWLRDSFVASDPLTTDKTQLLALIDELSVRVEE
jgi:hypothetical protein